MKNGNLVLICDTEKDPEMNKRTSFYLEKMGYRFFGGKPRQYEISTTGLSIYLTRGILIPQIISSKDYVADIGICSGPVLEEYDRDVTKLLDIPYGKKEPLLIYVNQKFSDVNDAKELKGKKIRVNTAWPNTARKYCEKRDIIYTISKEEGQNPIINEESNVIGIEYMPASDLWDCHKIIDSIESSDGAFISNPYSYKENQDKIDGFVHRFKMALNSEGWRLLKFNVPEKDLLKVKEYLPSMKGPTYSRLLDEGGWYAVEAALLNGEIEKVISRLKKNTLARDFLDQELNGIEL